MNQKSVKSVLTCWALLFVIVSAHAWANDERSCPTFLNDIQQEFNTQKEQLAALAQHDPDAIFYQELSKIIDCRYLKTFGHKNYTLFLHPKIIGHYRMGDQVILGKIRQGLKEDLVHNIDRYLNDPTERAKIQTFKDFTNRIEVGAIKGHNQVYKKAGFIESMSATGVARLALDLSPSMVPLMVTHPIATASNFTVGALWLANSVKWLANHTGSRALEPTVTPHRPCALAFPHLYPFMLSESALRAMPSITPYLKARLQTTSAK